MEQDLIESLVVESISIYGHGVYYCPRTLNNKDTLYGEATLSSYDSAYNIDMYIKSFDNYEGDGTFLSKFNLEIRDQVTFSLARRTFYNEIGNDANIDRPQEGDLIYSPMMNRLFIIKYVSQTAIFYQMGSLQIWDLVCEMFEYSNEDLNTGIAEIDNIEKKYSFASNSSVLLSNSVYANALAGNFQTNIDLETWGDDILDWTYKDPFSEGDV